MTEEIKKEEMASTKPQQAETVPAPVQSANDSKAPIKKTESLESVLRRFKRQSSGIISEVRKREAYDKPSVKRKKKSKEARKHKKTGRFNSNKW